MKHGLNFKILSAEREPGGYTLAGDHTEVSAKGDVLSTQRLKLMEFNQSVQRHDPTIDRG